METYHRKRSRRGTSINATTNNEMISLKRKENCSVLDGSKVQTPPFDRQLLLIDNNEDGQCDEVELGSVYEIYHKNFPPRTPVQLRCTRVVMVSEKTDLNVAIRYPSILSLRTYFSDGSNEMYPALDEKFVMGTKLASKVLLRQVPSQEFAAKKHLKGFWLVNPSPQQTVSSNVALKNENLGLARELKNNEMLRWGVRRQVMFIGRHKDKSNTQSSSSFVNGDDQEDAEQEENDEETKEEEEVEEEEEEEEEEEAQDEDDDEDADQKVVEMQITRKLRKRKKPNKQVGYIWQVKKKPMKKCKKLAIKSPTDRWSKERYDAAELGLLEAMKEKQAKIGNPITRPQLRIEARKRIGDTGLLDHLLKHVANKVAPGGKLRFRRSHNVDGAMEYWLEDANLVNIRKEAGVTDPFWTPPPGWKPGDSPTQDPVMAKQLNHLKEEFSTIKREIKEVIKHQEESKAIVVSEVVDKSPTQVMDICNFILNGDFEKTDANNSLLSKENSKKQMVVISDFLKKLQAWMQVTEVGKEETTQMESVRPKAAGSELITTTPETVVPNAHKASQKPKTTVADKNQKVVLRLESAAGAHQETSEKESTALKLQATGGASLQPPPSPPEGKADKIERLKSGFRLCKPQGTFLWPDMVQPTTTTTSSKSASNIIMQQQADDSLTAPTPPSVNSCTPPLPPYHHPHLGLPSPVKPKPERPPVTGTTTTTTPFINLNDIPTSPSLSTPPIIKFVSSGLKGGSWEAYSAGSKKRKSSSSSSNNSSTSPSPSPSSAGAPSCLSNTGTPHWLAANSSTKGQKWF
uniref:protein DYAD-like n=1 Tax=Erigeron canadensis TaxID=72917 RepID=UPI001CB9A0E2|nr:protein DYAD-like [Erigeron canadensis]